MMFPIKTLKNAMFKPSLHLEGEQSQAQVCVVFLELDSAFPGEVYLLRSGGRGHKHN
jgi:hypothetical protein